MSLIGKELLGYRIPESVRDSLRGVLFDVKVRTNDSVEVNEIIREIVSVHFVKVTVYPGTGAVILEHNGRFMNNRQKIRKFLNDHGFSGVQDFLSWCFRNGKFSGSACFNYIYVGSFFSEFNYF